VRDENMNRLDRGTLGVWRLGNILGWSLGALVVGVAISFAAEILFVDVLDAAIDPFTGGAVVPAAIELVFTAVFVGAAMGAVIGSRVYRQPMLTAAVVMLIYLSLWPFATIAARASSNFGVAIAVSAVLHMAAGLAAARYMSRRRARNTPA
jgi:hypothetical protein